MGIFTGPDQSLSSHGTPYFLFPFAMAILRTCQYIPQAFSTIFQLMVGLEVLSQVELLGGVTKGCPSVHVCIRGANLIGILSSGVFAKLSHTCSLHHCRLT
jgi:hypothetical protein